MGCRILLLDAMGTNRAPTRRVVEFGQVEGWGRFLGRVAGVCFGEAASFAE